MSSISLGYRRIHTIHTNTSRASYVLGHAVELAILHTCPMPELAYDEIRYMLQAGSGYAVACRCVAATLPLLAPAKGQ